MAKKILFFLDSLISGGRERRAIELFFYLNNNTDFEFIIVLTENVIHYDYVYDLGVPIKILRNRFFKKDPLIFYWIYKIVKRYNPDIIHSWSAMTTFYIIPSAKYFKIPILNSEIANAVPNYIRSIFLKVVWKINQTFSTLVISNSKAGLDAYNVKKEKGVVIYNGMRLDRFEGLNTNNLINNTIKVNTPYSIIMVASFGSSKDYELYFNIAKKIIEKRNDITFIAVGDGKTKSFFEEKVSLYGLDNFIFTGRVSNVEEIVNSCDIGVLFSNISTGEGISNSIMEYMALSKPVIATLVGGTTELVRNNKSGYLVGCEPDKIVELINYLIDKPTIRKQMGDMGREIIENNFTIERMGKEYVKYYNEILQCK